MLNSAQLSWAACVINLVCDYCQSQTPPRRTCALMGTMSPGTRPAMEGGRDERAKDGQKLRREKSTEREEKKKTLVGEMKEGNRDQGRKDNKR